MRVPVKSVCFRACVCILPSVCVQLDSAWLCPQPSLQLWMGFICILNHCSSCHCCSAAVTRHRQLLHTQRRRRASYVWLQLCWRARGSHSNRQKPRAARGPRGLRAGPSSDAVVSLLWGYPVHQTRAHLLSPNLGAPLSFSSLRPCIAPDGSRMTPQLAFGAISMLPLLNYRKAPTRSLDSMIVLLTFSLVALFILLSKEDP